MAKEKEPTGPEWFSTDDFVARYGIGRNQADARLKAMVTAGKLEKWMGCGAGGSGTKRRIAKYRML